MVWRQLNRCLPFRLVRCLISSDSRRRFLACGLLIAVSLGTLTKPAAAQERGDEGKQIVDGLLRALIESQLERSQRRQGSRFPPGTAVNPNRPGQPQDVTPEMARVRSLSLSFTNEAQGLVRLLSEEMKTRPQVRTHFADALQLQANSSVLAQQASRQRDHQAVIDDVRELNRDWRNVSYQLRQVDGLGQPCIQCMNRLDAFDQQLAAIYGITPQIDQRKLTRALDSLSTEFRAMADDISVEISPGSGRTSLLLVTRRLQQQCSQLANLVSAGGSYDRIVADYQTLYIGWRELAASLPGDSRYLARNINRIHSAHRDIHELLQLDVGLDSHSLLTMAASVESRVSILFRQINLEMLMRLQDSDRITNAADEVYGSCEHLADSVRRGERPENLIDAWQFMDQSWTLLEFYLRPIRNAQVRATIDQLDTEVAAIGDLLGVRIIYDQRAAAQLAATVEASAAQAKVQITHWLARSGQSHAHAAEHADDFLKHAKFLHRAIVTNNQPYQMRSAMQRLFTSWEELRHCFHDCNTEEAAVLHRLAAETTPLLVHLETMILL